MLPIGKRSVAVAGTPCNMAKGLLAVPGQKASTQSQRHVSFDAATVSPWSLPASTPYDGPGDDFDGVAPTPQSDSGDQMLSESDGRHGRVSLALCEDEASTGDDSSDDGPSINSAPSEERGNAVQRGAVGAGTAGVSGAAGAADAAMPSKIAKVAMMPPGLQTLRCPPSLSAPGTGSPWMLRLSSEPMKVKNTFIDFDSFDSDEHEHPLELVFRSGRRTRTAPALFFAQVTKDPEDHEEVLDTEFDDQEAGADFESTHYTNRIVSRARPGGSGLPQCFDLSPRRQGACGLAHEPTASLSAGGKDLLLQIPLDPVLQSAISANAQVMITNTILGVDGNPASIELRILLNPPSCPTAPHFVERGRSRKTDANMSFSGEGAPASGGGEKRMVCCHWKNKGFCKFESGCKFMHPAHKQGVGKPGPKVGLVVGTSSKGKATESCPLNITAASKRKGRRTRADAAPPAAADAVAVAWQSGRHASILALAQAVPMPPGSFYQAWPHV